MRYVRMIIIKEGSPQLKYNDRKWAFDSNYEFSPYDEHIFRIIEQNGFYHSNGPTNMKEGDYVLLDLDNDVIKEEMKKEPGGAFISMLNSFIREHKINKLIDE